MSPDDVQATKPFAVTLDVGSSLLNKTGSWRTERPVYVDRLPPCNHACPAGENIQAWLYHAEAGHYREAWIDKLEEATILEEPEIWGVQTLGESSVAIRLVVKTEPGEQWATGRELNGRLKRALDANGIEIPFPQRVVWMRAEGEDPEPV